MTCYSLISSLLLQALYDWVRGWIYLASQSNIGQNCYPNTLVQVSVSILWEPKFIHLSNNVKTTKIYFLGIKCWLPPLHVIVDSQWNKYSKYFVTTASTYNCTVSLRAVSLREMMLSSCFALVVNLRVLISQYPDRDWFVCRWSCRALHVRLRLGRKI